MRKQEIVINMLLILFSAAMFFLVIPAWTGEPQEYGLSGGTLPKLCCAAIALLAALQIVSGILKGIRPNGGTGISREMLLHLLMYFGPMFCIIPLWKYCGFLAGSAAVLFLLFLAAGRRDWKRIVPLSVGIPLCIMLLLRYGLQVPTP